MNDKFIYIEDELERLQLENLLRTENIFFTGQTPVVNINERKLILFSSSNYLSLSEDKLLFDRAVEKAKQFGMGSGGSRLTTGTNILHKRLEELLVEYFEYESATLFSSGYNANIGVISSVINKEDIIFSDEKNHASIIDGCRLSKAKIVTYKHNDMNDLRKKLNTYKEKSKIIISDGVFSMDGDILKLKDFVNLAREFSAFSIVDDAHGTGVIGETGKGIVEMFGAEYKPDILIATLSKAIGVEGGFAMSNNVISKFLRNKARSYIFSSSMSPLTVSSCIASLEYLLYNNTQVRKLKENINYVNQGLDNIGIISHSKTPIIKILVGDEKKAVEVSNKLYEEGIYVPAIRFPTVERSKAILRITIMSNHTKEQIDLLINCLKKYLN